MGLYINDDHRVGHLHMQSAAEERAAVPGYHLQLDASVETELFGIVAGMKLSGEAWTATSGETAEFEFSILASDTKMGLHGTIAENRLSGTLDTGGQSIPLDFPVDTAMVLGSGMGLPAAAMPELEPGESTTMAAFDPIAMTPSKAKVTCTGRETLRISNVPVETRVYETVLGGMTSNAWVDDSGEVVQASTPFGFTLRKISPAELDIPVVANESSDLIRDLAIVPTGKPMHNDASRLVVRVSGLDPALFPNDPPWQIRENDVVTIIQSSYPDSTEAGDRDNDFDPAPFLGDDAFVATNHPMIQEQAVEIIGDETDPRNQALLLHHWLYTHIDKVPVLSVPSALDVLRTKSGDCNEHTVLYTALARSIGIPTRIAIGLVYSDTLEGLGYHAWPEVHIGTQWYPLDPTLGQHDVDATHIKLFNGSIASWVQLAGYIGQIQLDVIACDE